MKTKIQIIIILANRVTGKPVDEMEDIAFLYTYIKKHYRYIGSKYANQIIENWEDMLPYFVQVIPVDYSRVLQRLKQQNSEESDLVRMTEEVF